MSINPYSFRPSTVVKALDKNKDGRITSEEVSRFQNRLPTKYGKAHAILDDINRLLGSGPPPREGDPPKELTLQDLKDRANSGSRNGLLNPVDFSNLPY